MSGTISFHPGPGVKKSVIQNTISKINFNSTFATDPIAAFKQTDCTSSEDHAEKLI